MSTKLRDVMVHLIYHPDTKSKMQMMGRDERLELIRTISAALGTGIESPEACGLLVYVLTGSLEPLK